MLGTGVPLTCLYGFSKNVFSRERTKSWFFVTFNIIISHIFLECFILIPQVVQKIWRFSPSRKGRRMGRSIYHPHSLQKKTTFKKSSLLRVNYGMYHCSMYQILIVEGNRWQCNKKKRRKNAFLSYIMSLINWTIVFY